MLRIGSKTRALTPIIAGLPQVNEPASYYDNTTFSTGRHIIESENRENAIKAGILDLLSGVVKSSCPF
jgi:hypothetical protein